MPSLRPKPRVMMSSRIREEYRLGLEAVVEQLRAAGWHDVQKYDVLEMMLQDLTSEAGRARVKRSFETRNAPVARE